jgi:hypothetical protein
MYQKNGEATSIPSGYSNPSPSGHSTGNCSPGQTLKKPKYLSVCDREEYGCGEGTVWMCDRVVQGRGGYRLVRSISTVMYT